MNSQLMVRLVSCTLDGIKNVLHGEVSMPHSLKGGDVYQDTAELLGIYGQNGSGKTSVVDAMACVQVLMSGRALQKEKIYLVTQGREKGHIECVFALRFEELRYRVRYSVTLSTIDDELKIVEERLEYQPARLRARYRSVAEYEISSPPVDSTFLPEMVYRSLITKLKDKRDSLTLAKRKAYDDAKSYIFNDETYEIFQEGMDVERAGILRVMRWFAQKNLTIIERQHSGLLSLNLLPLSTMSKYGHGHVPMLLDAPNVMPLPMYEKLKALTLQLNGVLNSIIPGLSVDVYELGTKLTEQGIEVMRFELVSVRGNVKIPLRYESEGVRKILSILGSMIDVYNNPSACLIVDELDAGIFEYLLGELLKVIQESGKGQLIFTSHNLRPLEMLSKESVLFSTTNPMNRYIRFTGIKANNNLRNCYICEINLQEQAEQVYCSTNTSSMNRAFFRAGKEMLS